MTEAIYSEVSAKTEAVHKVKRRASVSGMLKISGVSRSGYYSWLHRPASNFKQRKEARKAKILKIYNISKQNYGATKVAKKLQQLDSWKLSVTILNSTVTHTVNC